MSGICVLRQRKSSSRHGSIIFIREWWCFWKFWKFFSFYRAGLAIKIIFSTKYFSPQSCTHACKRWVNLYFNLVAIETKTNCHKGLWWNPLKGWRHASPALVGTLKAPSEDMQDSFLGKQAQLFNLTCRRCWERKSRLLKSHLWRICISEKI